MKKTLLLTVLILFLGSSMPSSQALFGGKVSDGENFAVRIIVKDTDSEKDSYTRCSGILLTKRIVISAAHCTILSSGNVSKSIIAIKPGKEILATNMALVEKIFVDPNYKSGKSVVAADDIAFFYLDRDFDEPAVTRIATDFEIWIFFRRTRRLAL